MAVKQLYHVVPAGAHGTQPQSRTEPANEEPQSLGERESPQRRRTLKHQPGLIWLFPQPFVSPLLDTISLQSVQLKGSVLIILHFLLGLWIRSFFTML